LKSRQPPQQVNLTFDEGVRLQDRLARWLALIDGPGWEGREGRARVVEEMRAEGVDTVVPLLATKLADPDPEVRHRAITALLFVDALRALDLVLPMLNDPVSWVRWHTCGCLHDFGDERAVGPLVAVLEGDPNPQMRSTAAYALGGVGHPTAIPALLRALDQDHEPDIHGHSASSCAATALDDILGTNETRIRVSGSLCRIRSGEPDLDLLRRLAAERFQRWLAGSVEQAAAPDRPRE
jgi:HEAT repeat protein